MTYGARLAATGLLGLVLALTPACGLVSAAEDAPELPEHVVARVLNADGSVAAELTFETFKIALVAKVQPELDDLRSAPLTVLREMVEQRVVELEGVRLGLVVTPEELRAYEAQLDQQIRLRTGGQQTLKDVRVSKGMTFAHFQEVLRLQLLKDEVAAHSAWLGKLPENERQRISQVEVVVAQLSKKSRLVWCVSVSEVLLQQAGQREPQRRNDGVLVLVDDTPITRAEYGAALLERLPEDVLKDVVERESATKLLQVKNVALDDAGMEAELVLRETNWIVQRTLLSQTEWHSVGYEEFLKATLKMSRAELKADRYYRSYYGLVRREREKLTEEMLLAEFTYKASSSYGTALLVDALQIGYERSNPLLSGGPGGRDRREALQIAQGVLGQLARGQPFREVIRDLLAQHTDPHTKLPDRTLRGGERRLYNIESDRLLFDQAKLLKDGETSGVIETLSEVHLLRRKESVPGPTYETVRDVIRDNLAGQMAGKIIQNETRQSGLVRVRWPIRKV